MNLQELYEKLEGDYAGTLSRLMKEERIAKYLGKFINDTVYSELMKNLEENDFAEAFRNSHTLKGVALNLGISRLAASSSELCESLRNGPPTVDITGMKESVIADYEETVRVLKEYL